MDFEVLIIGSDVNAYYMARCTHEAYNKKAYMLIKDNLAFTKHSKIEESGKLFILLTLIDKSLSLKDKTSFKI